MYRFPTDDGIQFALRIWITFILVLWLLRFRAELAILLGAIAGVMAGILMTYWKAQKLPNAPAPPPENPARGWFQVSSTITERLRRSTEKSNREQATRKPRRRHLGKSPNWKR